MIRNTLNFLFLYNTKTNLCKVLSHLFLQALWDFQGNWTPLSLSGLPHLLLVVPGMSQRVVVFIQQLQLLDKARGYTC